MTHKKLTDEIIYILKRGGVGVMPTDTIYGVVGSALNSKAVEKIYRLRKRNKNKPMIILISSLDDLKIFRIKTNVKTARFLQKFWPGKVSVILRVRNQESGIKFRYLHRGSNSLAFRLPRPMRLRKLLQKTGPLVAPSANWEGSPPAKTIRAAKKYFGKKVDFYLDAGNIVSKPSTLIHFHQGQAKILRRGAEKI